MPKRKPALPDEMVTELEAPYVRQTVGEVVRRERERGWAFKNEDGRYERQDALDRLWAAGLIDHTQHQAGKRYQRQFSAAYEYGRCVSTLEFRRSDQALSDGAIQAAVWLRDAQREALGGHPALVRAMASICELGAPASDQVAVRAALARLAAYYSVLEDESEEIEAAPARRTLRDRGAELAANWQGLHGLTRRTGHDAKNDLKRLLWEAQNKRCSCCGGELPDPSGAEPDHVWALSRGGCDAPGNLTLAHATCNRRKRSSKPRRYELEVLSAVNEILGWAQPDREASVAERIADALSRVANPSPVQRAGRRHVHLPKMDDAPPEAPSHLVKEARGEGSMHEKWLASQGVLKSNRTMRARGVNSGSRRK